MRLMALRFALGTVILREKRILLILLGTALHSCDAEYKQDLYNLRIQIWNNLTLGQSNLLGFLAILILLRPIIKQCMLGSN